jgi:hypothetical protein
MNRADHHAKAEQLLEQARTTPDQISRSEILAEAQVHATLALSAPAGTGPPGPGQGEAADTQSTGTAHQDMPEGSGPFEMQPHSSSAGISRGGWRDPASSETLTGKSSDRGSRGRGTGGLRIREPAPAAPPRQEIPPSSTEDPRSAWRPEEQPRKQEPDPAQEQEPDPGDQKPGGPAPSFR